MQSENRVKNNVYPSGKETCPKYNKESICRKYLGISIFSNLSVNWPKELFNKKTESCIKQLEPNPEKCCCNIKKGLKCVDKKQPVHIHGCGAHMFSWEPTKRLCKNVVR
jgi:hypothetical protein